MSFDNVHPRFKSLAEDMERDLMAINTHMKTILDGWERSRLPAALYHFTDVGGLMGIVRDRTLHASLATTMNDSTEIVHAIKRVKDKLDAGDNVLRGLSAQLVKECLDGKRTVGRLPLEQRHYVASFCGGKEHALHWLHYGRSGTGVALGFEGNALLSIGQFQLRPVVYRPERQDEVLLGLTRMFDDFYLRYADAYPNRADLDETCSYMLSSFVGQLASMFKHESFESENEWRLILPEGDPIHEVEGAGDPNDPNPPEPSLYVTSLKTNGAGRLVPYKVIDFKNERHFAGRFPLTSIVLGASSPMKHDDQALRVMMEGDRHTFGRVEVSQSSVPVRP